MSGTLLVTSSARGEASVSTRLARTLAEKLAPEGFATRDVSADMPLIDGAWLAAAFTAPDARDPAQAATVALSDTLIEELRAADTIVIALPVYNFLPPAQLKSWFDHVARAGITFRYTENGPIGLLKGKKAYIAMASNGTQLGSDIDFASAWTKHMLGFIGIETVEIIAADRQSFDETSVADALAQIEALPVAA